MVGVGDNFLTEGKILLALTNEMIAEYWNEVSYLHKFRKQVK